MAKGSIWLPFENYNETHSPHKKLAIVFKNSTRAC